MSYWTLRYDPRVRKALERIRDREVIRRLKEAAEELRSKPFSGRPLRGYPGVWSRRVGTKGGEWRIIYMPLREERVIFVILIGPREAIYDLLRRKGPGSS